MKNKNALLVWLVIIVIVIAGLIWWAYVSVHSANNPPPVTPPPPVVNTFDKTISDGTITAAYPSTEFGLATNPTQILTKSYIPPCETGFNYCLYYIGTSYTGTNFESAGVRIQKRTDLSTERICLSTPPVGFDATKQPNATTSANLYSSSVFTNVGGAGAGHYAAGSLYRLYYRQSSTCYEFETRIGQTQFANYPAGSIQEFTTDKQAMLAQTLYQILNSTTLKTGEINLFSGLQ